MKYIIEKSNLSSVSTGVENGKKWKEKKWKL